MTTTDFRSFGTRSPEYRKALALREAVLRAPVGMSLSDEDLAGEDRQFHFGAFREDRILACVSLKPLNSNFTLELRQMAVSPDVQRQGLGRRLVRFAEDAMDRNSFQHIELSARQSAVGFYEKLGYRITGEPSVKLGIKHVRLSKSL